MNGITKDTFKDADRDTQMLILFDVSITTNDAVTTLTSHCPDQRRECEAQLVKIRSGQRWDKAWSVAGGFIGGFSAMVAKVAFWK